MAYNKHVFKDLSFDMCGDLYCSQHDLRELVTKHGGSIVRITDNLPVNYLISSDATLAKGHPKITKAKSIASPVPILDAYFIRQCVRSGKLLPVSLFALPGKPSLLPSHIFYGGYVQPSKVARASAPTQSGKPTPPVRTSLLSEPVLSTGYYKVTA